MSEPGLDPAEMEAIQAAMRQGVARNAPVHPAESSPLQLIASDRDAQSARPRLLAVSSLWIRHLERALRPLLSNDIKLEVVGAELIDGRLLRDELRTAWCTALRAPGKPGAMVIAVGGSIIEAAAARRCGANEIATIQPNREPTPVAIRLFEPAGRAIEAALVRAFRDRESLELISVPGTDLSVDTLFDCDAVVALTLAVTAPCPGRIRLLAPPAAAAAQGARLEAVRAEAAAAVRALGQVQVELTAVLGEVQISLAELGALTPGATFTLPTFVDATVPIYVGGVLVARGKPVISRGVLAVEIEADTQGVRR